MAAVLVLWSSLGGHWVEILFLHWVRPRLSPASSLQTPARFLVRFTGGALLAFAMRLTASAIFHSPIAPWLSWWVAGATFIAFEMIVHFILHLRRQPSLFTGIW